MNTALGEISGRREANSTSVEMSPTPMSDAWLAVRVIASAEPFGRLDRHVEPEFARNIRARARGRSAAPPSAAKFSTTPTFVRPLCLAATGTAVEQRKCPEREGPILRSSS